MIDPVIAATVAAYALAIVVVGAGAMRREQGSVAFLLADRTLGTGFVFASLFSTFLGTGIVFTFGAFGYQYGVGALALPAAAVVGFLPLAWVAPRIKALSDHRDAVTLPELMAGTWRTRTRVLAALMTGGLFAGALGANVLAAGTLLEAVAGVPVRIGVIAFGVIVVGYTALGGFRGSVRTDSIQAVLIVGSILVVLPAFVVLGPGADVVDSVPASHVDPSAIPTPIVLVYLLLGPFTFFGSQDIQQRIFAARDGHSARRGLLLFAISLAVVGAVTVGLGIVARAAVPGVSPDQALLALTDDMTAPWLLGTALLGLLALVNSDADSQLLTVTSTLTHDLRPHLGSVPFVDRDPWTGERAWIDRITVAGVGGVAVGLAAIRPDVVALLAGLGSLFAILGVVTVLTLFWDGTTDRGAFAGLAGGITLSAVTVVATGSVQPAPVVGGVVTAVVCLVGSVIDGQRAGIDTGSIQ